MRIFIIILFSFAYIEARCQQNENGANIVQDITEEITESLTESGQSDLPEELTKLSSNPVDLNSDDIDLLVLTGLITTEQLNSIKQHIIKYGKMVEPEELQLINTIDKKTIRKILPYIIVYSKKDTPSASQLTMRYQTSLINSDDYYNGSPSRVLIRYRSTINSSVKTGLTFEKDEGEEIFTKSTPTFDFYSFYIMYSPNRKIRKIIIGDYNVEFGQGLNAWSGISFGNASQVTSIFKYGRGIIPYSGTDENRFFRGFAIAVEKKKLSIDAWLSYHHVDANVFTDSLSNDKFVTTLQYSGYHRNYSEKMDYHSQTEYAAGTHLKYKFKNGEAGIVSSGQKFSVPVAGSSNYYSKFGFRGTMSINNGFYYSYTLKNIILFGEQSFSSSGSIASINGIIISADPKFSIGILYRNYPRTFYNLKSNAFGINSANSNERGTYIAINYSIFKQLTYSSFMDAYSFPFLKYKVDAPSEGNEYFHQLEFKPNKKFIAQLRYRVRHKQENTKAEYTESGVISDYTFKAFRIGSTIKIDNTWTYGLRIEFSESVNEQQKTKGTMISQDVFYHPMGKKYSFNFRYSVFNCPDFDSRIYEYENDVLGAFSVPFYYGNGSRFYININLHVGRKINLSVRYSKTWQEDPENYNSRNDIKVQLRINF